MKKIILLILVVGLSAFQEMIDLPPGGFFQKIQNTPNAVILDVRTSEEAANGHLANSMLLNYREDQFEKQIASLDKDKTYFVYCGNGVRSDQAIDIMEKLGFKRYYNLVGGFKAWKADGLSFEVDSKDKKDTKNNKDNKN
ncbi:MAG TPA: rhodanese-like domain-containing protein [Cyclobacteriaceae bacterium]|nr:rhodanese-like domain-containing protein [Cyclobacteriaceae bacterium]